MIQRIQTVYLLLAAILAVVCSCIRLTWLDVLQLLNAAVCLGTIFLYAKRVLQAKICLVALLLVFAWYIGLAVIQGYVNTVDCLPMIEAILIFLARRGIIHDEKLVRAADRIR
jgi:hypothetical protein